MTGKRILIVDDEKAICKTVSAYLEDNDHVVYDANNGYKALEIIAKNEIDIAVIDLTMPQMSGFTLIKQVNANYPDVLIIVATGITDKKTAIQTWNSTEDDKFNVYEILTKPIDLESLVNLIENC